MKRLWLLVTVALALSGADFMQWWPGFQTAVARGDGKSVAAGVQFPLNWENGKIREIKSEDELVKNFATYFTPEIRKVVAARKPVRSPEGTYTITWKARGNEYSLYFKPKGNGFVLDGLSEGPA